MTLDLAFDNSYARLPARFFTPMPPVAVAAPELIALNDALARELGLDPAALRSPEGVAMLAGNLVPKGAAPLAQVYAGHQFGGWVPQLGDGRAILLGELIDIHGRRRDIQLKGAGQTPYSRRGDGRAWLGPVLREYLVSEAMFALGIPTTRALAVVLTGEDVQRERRLPGAVLTRVAASHIRVGTFQYFAARRDTEALRALTDHTTRRHFPRADGALGLLRAAIAAQARLVAGWMGVGFVHGVMNTDNMALSGETIDYGPCAFIDRYHPDTVFSSIDRTGRYAFSKQADVAVWNLAQLASALLPLIDGCERAAIDAATAELHAFPEVFREDWLGVFRAKIGLATAEPQDADLIHDLLDLMAETGADFTNTFRGLSGDLEAIELSDRAALKHWAERWRARRERDGRGDHAQTAQMRAANPAYIPRNHRIEAMIDTALQGDYARFRKLLAVTAHPFDDQPENAEFRAPPLPGEAVRQTFCGT